MALATLSLAALLASGASAAATPFLTHPKAPTGLIASSYFAAYHDTNKVEKRFGVDQIPWQKYTDVKWAFAESTANGMLDLTKTPIDQLPAFVKAAHDNNVLATVSYGGWSGSMFASTNMATPESRSAFVKIVLEFLDKYQLDGMDFDWEYLNRQGLGCNDLRADDTQNFLEFLRELRAKSTRGLYLTAAASLAPWNDKNAKPSTDNALAPFAEVLDYIMIMGYDVYGAWAPTGGPNAPLSRSCDSRNNQGAIDESVQQWIKAGIPASKLTLGAPAYAHSFSVTKANAFVNGELVNYPIQDPKNRLKGGSWDNDPPTDACGNPQPPSGTYTFWSLIEEGKFLDENGEPRSGIDYAYDQCSQTPYLYKAETETWVSYDDVKSMSAKGDFIVSNKLKGFVLFETGGDYKNKLVDTLRRRLNL